MSFITSAVAGPSRIPYGTAARVVCSTSHCGARAGARRTYADERSAREGGAEADAAAGIAGGVGIRERPAPGDRPKNYDEWLYKVAYQYKRPVPGRKARWLGKEVPYASNPSFRPPPPLSDAFMSVLSAEMRSGKRTIGQISQAHNVSKHRLDAIRKLKEVEDEFVRQKLPLQYAFQENMEALLGVDRSHDARAKATVEEKRNAELERLSHPSVSVELQEEHDAADRPGAGAFGSLDNEASLEKDVWELQDEQTYLANQKAEAKARADRKAEELEEIAKGTDSQLDAAKESGPKLPAHTATAGRSVYRFIDTSRAASKESSKQRK